MTDRIKARIRKPDGEGDDARVPLTVLKSLVQAEVAPLAQRVIDLESSMGKVYTALRELRDNLFSQYNDSGGPVRDLIDSILMAAYHSLDGIDNAYGEEQPTTLGVDLAEGADSSATITLDEINLFTHRLSSLPDLPTISAEQLQALMQTSTTEPRQAIRGAIAAAMVEQLDADISALPRNQATTDQADDIVDILSDIPDDVDLSSRSQTNRRNRR